MAEEKKEDKEEIIELSLKGTVKGHKDWVTSIVAGYPEKENEDSPLLISGSRDRTILIWKFKHQDNQQIGQLSQLYLYKVLTGHSHFISDMTLTYDNKYLISASWDKTLRLWDLEKFECIQKFIKHEKEVLSVAISPQMKEILSSGADKKIYIWNKKGESKNHIQNHNDWISCVRFLGNKTSAKSASYFYFATSCWDGRLKTFSSNNMEMKDNFLAHQGHINHLAVSRDGKLIATGGKDKKINIWNFYDTSKPEKQFNAGGVINQLAFSPMMMWIAAGTENGISIWDLKKEDDCHSAQYQLVSPKKEQEKKDEKTKKEKEKKYYQCTSLTWNASGRCLFAGYTDGSIRIYEIVQREN